MILPKAPKKKKYIKHQSDKMSVLNRVWPAVWLLAFFCFFFCFVLMLRLLTYKVVNDANDAVNVFAQNVVNQISAAVP